MSNPIKDGADAATDALKVSSTQVQESLTGLYVAPILSFIHILVSLAVAIAYYFKFVNYKNFGEGYITKDKLWLQKTLWVISSVVILAILLLVIFQGNYLKEYVSDNLDKNLPEMEEKARIVSIVLSSVHLLISLGLVILLFFFSAKLPIVANNQMYLWIVSFLVCFFLLIFTSKIVKIQSLEESPEKEEKKKSWWCENIGAFGTGWCL